MCMCMCAYECVCAYVHVCVHVCMHVYMCVYVHESRSVTTHLLASCQPHPSFPSASEALPWHPMQGVENLETQLDSRICYTLDRCGCQGADSGAAMHSKDRLSSSWEETWHTTAMTDRQAPWQCLIKPDVLCLKPFSYTEHNAARSDMRWTVRRTVPL